jgi:hypothetical protein
MRSEPQAGRPGGQKQSLKDAEVEINRRKRALFLAGLMLVLAAPLAAAEKTFQIQFPGCTA